jgi:transposase-like protein
MSLIEVFMTEKRTCRQYPPRYKKDAGALITVQCYRVQKGADSLGICSTLLYRWQRQLEDKKSGKSLSKDERSEPKDLRNEVRELGMEKAILKKRQHALREGNEVQYRFIYRQSSELPVTVLCQVMAVSSSAY